MNLQTRYDLKMARQDMQKTSGASRLGAQLKTARPFAVLLLLPLSSVGLHKLKGGARDNGR
jgi:hypothetical protein